MTNLINKTCLLDTNILVAWINPKNKHNLLADKLLMRIINGEFHAVISSQNILELTSVLLKVYKIPAKQVADDIEKLTADQMLDVIYPNDGTISKFLSLIQSTPQMHPSDLFLTATAISWNLDVVITEDHDFSKLETRAIEIYNPFFA